MNYIATTLAAFTLLFASACDDPDQVVAERVRIEMSANNAAVHSEDGELLLSVSPDDLITSDDEGFDVLEVLSIAPRDPLAFCFRLCGCVDNGNGTTTCKLCPVSPVLCQLN